MISDNISRQAAIEHLKKWFHSKGWMVSDEDCKSILWDVPPVDNWIPCSERLPEGDGDVIMTNITEQVKVGYHSEGTWWFIKDDGFITGVNDNVNAILAWMPLPEPYKKMEAE